MFHFISKRLKLIIRRGYIKYKNILYNNKEEKYLCPSSPLISGGVCFLDLFWFNVTDAAVGKNHTWKRYQQRMKNDIPYKGMYLEIYTYIYI